MTTRHSGGSYLNRVELMNGCLAKGHCNLFIPSTLNGSCNGRDGIDKTKLHQNLESAIDVYIDRVNGAPCEDASICLVKGAKDEIAQSLQERRTKLLTFLPGSQKDKETLKKTDSTLFQYFEEVWAIRNSHMVKDLPEKYIFMLIPCYQPTCFHPVCKKGGSSDKDHWFEGGPQLKNIPLPIPDKERPWGGPCAKCGDQCPGHYLKPEATFKEIQKHGTKNCMIFPPTERIKKEYNASVKAKNPLEQSSIQTLAQKNTPKGRRC